MTDKTTEEITVASIVDQVGAENVSQVCDKLLERSVELMALVAPAEMIVDRIMTYGVAQIVHLDGKQRAMEVLAGIISQIQQGGFDGAQASGNKH